MSKIWLVVIIVLILAAGGYYFMKGSQTTTPAPQPQQTTETDTQPTTPAAAGQTIQLAEQNASGETGTAVLSEKDGKVTVTLTMTGAPTDVPQPAHIHVGACPAVGAVAYPLTNVVNGVSETTLDVTLAELAAKQPLGINVHKSAPEAKVYVACGDLAISSTSSATSPAPTTETNSNY